MLQVKIFIHRSTDGLEKEINEWFIEHGETITVEKVIMTQSDTVAIFYDKRLPNQPPFR